jgi:hypothetical protein
MAQPNYLTAAILLLTAATLPSFAQGRGGRGGAAGATAAPVDISQSRTMDQVIRNELRLLPRRQRARRQQNEN